MSKRQKPAKKKDGSAVSAAPEIKSKKRPRGRPFPKGQSGNPETMFKPGESGNPGGRPSTQPISNALRRRLLRPYIATTVDSPVADRIADAQIKQALAGSVQHFAQICDRAEGKVAQRIEFTGEDGGPIEIADARNRLVEKLLR